MENREGKALRLSSSRQSVRRARHRVCSFVKSGAIGLTGSLIVVIPVRLIAPETGFSAWHMPPLSRGQRCCAAKLWAPRIQRSRFATARVTNIKVDGGKVQWRKDRSAQNGNFPLAIALRTVSRRRNIAVTSLLHDGLR